MAFDKSKYDIDYRKEHKVQFNVDLNKDENEELTKLLQKHNLKKVDFIRWAMKELAKKDTNK